MADLRAVFDIQNEDYEAFACQFDSTITFDAKQSGNSAAVGLAVVLTGNGTVGLTVDASAVHGKLVRVEWDGWCTVQFDGGCYLPAGNGATVTAGSKIVGALGAAAAKGYIRNVAPATLAEVAVARHTICDASDATKVQVMFD